MRDIPDDIMQAADKLWEMLPAKPLEESTGIECVRLLALAILAERQRWAEAEPVFTMCEACGSSLNEKAECDCTRMGLDCQRVVGLIPRPILSPSVKET